MKLVGHFFERMSVLTHCEQARGVKDIGKLGSEVEICRPKYVDKDIVTMKWTRVITEKGYSRDRQQSRRHYPAKWFEMSFDKNCMRQHNWEGFGRPLSQKRIELVRRRIVNCNCFYNCNKIIITSL